MLSEDMVHKIISSLSQATRESVEKDLLSMRVDLLKDAPAGFSEEVVAIGYVLGIINQVNAEMEDLHDPSSSSTL